MQVEQLKSISYYKDNPVESYSTVERANIYAGFILEVGRNDRWFLTNCFGIEFCKMVDSLIEFILLENDKRMQDVKSIKFYGCRGGKKSKTMISRIKFK